MIAIVMGVSGVGKTSVAKEIARRLGWSYLEGDDFHPQSNVAKMSRGIPLNDEDRAGWLASIRTEMEAFMSKGQNAVVTCSALKQSYRDRLKQGSSEVVFIYLKAEYETVKQRMDARQGHFMKSTLLESQFITLEEPTDAIVIPAEHNVEESTALAVRALTTSTKASS